MTSLVGYTLAYSNLDNYQESEERRSRHVHTGRGGSGRRYALRSQRPATFATSTSCRISDDIVGIARLQGGDLTGIAGYQPRVFDNFNLGPSLVRGFAPGGIGPRDISNWTSTQGNSLGGTDYIGGTLEVQFPIWGLPKDIGLRGALFTDAGSLWNYRGQTNFSKSLYGIPNLPCTLSLYGSDLWPG